MKEPMQITLTDRERALLASALETVIEQQGITWDTRTECEALIAKLRDAQSTDARQDPLP